MKFKPKDAQTDAVAAATATDDDEAKWTSEEYERASEILPPARDDKRSDDDLDRFDNLETPPVIDVDRDLKPGDDVRIARREFGYWGTLLKVGEDGSLSLLMTSGVPCNNIFAANAIVDVPPDKVWLSHAPGSHLRFLKHLLEANLDARTGDKPRASEGRACWQTFEPCYLHEPQLIEGFEDVRGCWRCGKEVSGGVDCPCCKKARYCDAKCARSDLSTHIYPCSYWIQSAHAIR